MKRNIGHGIKTIAFSGFAVITLAMTVACSDSKKPGPDDGDDGGASNRSAKISCLSSKEFRYCAETLLEKSEVALGDREELKDSCKLDDAQAQETAADVFEVARQSIKASCL